MPMFRTPALPPRRHRLLSASSVLDRLCLLMLVAITLYLLVREPILLTILGCATVVFLGLYHIIRTIPILETLLDTRLQFWHVVTAIMTCSLLLDVSVAPAQALFLSGLENFFIELAETAASSGGATETLGEDVVRLIFSLIRGVFLLLVAAAALFAYNQAQQGNDWRPIVVQVGLAFAIVIAIDVVTFLFIGDGTVGASLPAPVVAITPFNLSE